MCAGSIYFKYTTMNLRYFAVESFLIAAITAVVMEWRLWNEKRGGKQTGAGNFIITALVCFGLSLLMYFALHGATGYDGYVTAELSTRCRIVRDCMARSDGSYSMLPGDTRIEKSMGTLRMTE